ncbi:di-heme oxidoredictase family protein [Rhizobium halophytocola]|uniref:Cytochrome c peroxidase n=1 Tax=Rhizobium halophytocola TaxID=735519 RepID=A0ABS4E578_9HYPH|nr:di-heme oxidoredictase family protein [Rhizobium halophytocola]MBP1853090.1 cytochrome c peroxidase [Rhizobium halophytocola]
MTMRTSWWLLAAGSWLAGSMAVQAGAPWEERSAAIGAAGQTVAGRISGDALERLRAIGLELFKGEFTVNDGVGRPGATQAIVPTKRRHPAATEFNRTAGLDANACSGCHNKPIVGGAGDFVTNVFVSEGFESADFDTTDPQFSNERGTNHLFGAGLIELLAREMTADLQGARDKGLDDAARTGEVQAVRLVTKGVDFGRLTVHPDGIVDLDKLDGVDMDLVIRPFSQKGVMTSLRQFTVNAMNQHHGMEAVERFGGRWTGTADFDEDGRQDELADGDISALVAWQAGLEPPTTAVVEQAFAARAASGAHLFESYGCDSCHRQELPLSSLDFADPGPVDAAGTLNDGQVKQVATYDLASLPWAKTLKHNEKGEVLVPLFGDLKRHVMTDNRIDRFGNELLAQRFVDRNIFMTTELWGISSTAPYGHRNDITTLDEVILAHGGEARAARDAYADASKDDRADLIAFLKTLVIPQ